MCSPCPLGASVGGHTHSYHGFQQALQWVTVPESNSEQRWTQSYISRWNRNNTYMWTELLPKAKFKFIEVDQEEASKQRQRDFKSDKWTVLSEPQALKALHRTLTPEHHDFFLPHSIHHRLPPFGGCQRNIRCLLACGFTDFGGCYMSLLSPEHMFTLVCLGNLRRITLGMLWRCFGRMFRGFGCLS